MRAAEKKGSISPPESKAGLLCPGVSQSLARGCPPDDEAYLSWRDGSTVDKKGSSLGNEVAVGYQPTFSLAEAGCAFQKRQREKGNHFLLLMQSITSITKK